jgi:outer membrane scaffolding protein for murein synthesis (MipA/OmpV family)
MHKIVIPTIILGLAFASPAFASDSNPHTKHAWRVDVGTALVYAPDYLGADSYSTQLLPDLRVSYQDTFFASVPEGIGYNLINRNTLKAGPIAKINFGRDEDGDSPFRLSGSTNDLNGLGDIDTSLEIGGFAEHRLPLVEGSINSRFELRQALGGHEGLLAEVSINYAHRKGSVWYSFGPHLTWGNNNYNQAFFGIDAFQSIRAGLANYTANSGIVSVGFGGIAGITLTPSMSFTAFAALDRLGHEATSSPLITERGTQTQANLGFGLSYRFNLPH